MMSPIGIESALEDRFRLLTGGSRTSLARQQTLEASVAWSYDLLDPDEQAVARRLAVMSDFTLDAAEAVAADDRDTAVLDLLTHLVDKSIVRVDHTTAVTRYRFLESIRQFLHGRLVESGEVERVRVRHLAYFLALVESVEPRDRVRRQRPAAGDAGGGTRQPRGGARLRRRHRAAGGRVAARRIDDAVLGVARAPRPGEPMVGTPARRGRRRAERLARSGVLGGGAHRPVRRRRRDDERSGARGAGAGGALRRRLDTRSRAQHDRVRDGDHGSRAGPPRPRTQRRARAADRRRLGGPQQLEDDDGRRLGSAGRGARDRRPRGAARSCGTARCDLLPRLVPRVARLLPDPARRAGVGSSRARHRDRDVRPDR